MSTEPRALSFATPDGRIGLGAGDLDPWAEHLAWCYRALGVRQGATVALQDFGPSPLAFLASSQLTPLLDAGVAERLGGRIICLDASHERVALTPRVLRLLIPDVLVVRAEVVGLLRALAGRHGVDLAAGGATRLIVAGPEDAPEGGLDGWKRLLLVERSLLIAPHCPECLHFHLSPRRYDFDGAVVRALAPDGLEPYRFRRLIAWTRGGCDVGAEDWRLRLGLPEEAA